MPVSRSPVCLVCLNSIQTADADPDSPSIRLAYLCPRVRLLGHRSSACPHSQSEVFQGRTARRIYGRGSDLGLACVEAAIGDDSSDTGTPPLYERTNSSTISLTAAPDDVLRNFASPTMSAAGIGVQVKGQHIIPFID